MIYLDNAATTEIDYHVLKAMMPYLKENYGNAGSLHSMGRTAYNAVQHAREQVAKFINASPEQIIFTSGGTEANNMAINSAVYYSFNWDSKAKTVVSKYEHDSILNRVLPYNSFYIRVNENGIVDVKSLQELLSLGNPARDIALVSIMHTNNEIGAVNPISEIGKLCRKYKVPFHTDCVQAAGFSELDVEKFQCDFLTISSHKIHGPKGVGALYVRNPDNFTPLIYGGNSQEFGLRGGTENVAGIVGFGAACERSGEHLDVNRRIITRSYQVFSEALENGLGKHRILNKLNYNSPYPSKVLNIRFDGVRSESLLMMLDSKGVCVSAGSACNASDGKPSHVLKAIGLTDEEARSSIRVSFSKFNTAEECAEAGKIVANAVKMLLEI